MTQNIRLNTKKTKHISYWRILIIALPLVVDGLAFTVMSFTDSLFLIRYDVLQAAASSSAVMVALTFTSPINAIILFGSNMVAQYYGAKRFDMIATTIWTSLAFALVMTVVLLAIMPMVSHVFNLFGHSAELMVHQKVYIRYIFVGAIIGFFNTAFLNYFMGIGQTIKVMMVAIISNVVNIWLNWGLIFGNGSFPEMGIQGAGVATVISSIVALTFSFSFYLVASGKHKSLLKPMFDFDVLRRLWHFGLPSGFQMGIEMGAYTVMILVFASISPEVAVATGLVFEIQSFVYMPVVSLASGGAIIAAQERGAKNFAVLKMLVRRVLVITVSYSMVGLIIFWCFPDQIVNFFENTKEPERWAEVLKIARPLILITGVWLIPDAFYNVYLQMLQAMGDGVFIMKMFAIVTPLTIIVPSLILMQLEYNWVVSILYSTIILYVVVLWIIFGLRYRSGLWKQHSVIE
jgi:MATE family multidrug resistance protein